MRVPPIEIGEELEQLYQRRYVAFCRMASAVTGTAETGRDAVQEGFARALAASGTYRGDGTLDAWVWRIIVRAAAELRTTDQTRLPDDGDDSYAGQWWLTEPPGVDRDPALAAAIRRLTPRQRLMLFLRYFADLSHADIAAIAQVRGGTVSATLAQAKTALARELGLVTAATARKENHQ